LIEIGHERRASFLRRRLASAFGSMAALLLLIWLVRGILTISQYSEQILLASFGLILLGLAFNTRTRYGVGRAISSLLGNISGALWLILVLIWFLGWVASIQSSTFPPAISKEVTNLVVVAIALGLLWYVARALTPIRRNLHAEGPAILIHSNSDVKGGKTTLSTKADTIALPIARAGKTEGCVIFGEVKASFETPMGPVTANFAKPVTSFGVPFRGDRAGKEDVLRLTGQNSDQLTQGVKIDPTVPKLEGTGHIVDLPFVHVREDWFGGSVEVGPLSVRRGPEGESVKLGPFEFHSDEEGERHPSWLARGGQESSFLNVEDDMVTARWNGSSLWMKGDSMRLTAGADGFYYSPTEVRTFSPLHLLQVGNQKMSLNTRKFTLNVSAEKVVLRAESGSKSTDSPDLARDLRNLFTEEAKKHVQDVVKGVPIDLDEMLSSTEEVLKKYD